MILAHVCVWCGMSVECLAVGRLRTASRGRSSAAGLPGADGEEQLQWTTQAPQQTTLSSLHSSRTFAFISGVWLLLMRCESRYLSKNCISSMMYEYS